MRLRERSAVACKAPAGAWAENAAARAARMQHPYEQRRFRHASFRQSAACRKSSLCRVPFGAEPPRSPLQRAAAKQAIKTAPAIVVPSKTAFPPFPGMRRCEGKVRLALAVWGKTPRCPGIELYAYTRQRREFRAHAGRAELFRSLFRQAVAQQPNFYFKALLFSALFGTASFLFSRNAAAGGTAAGRSCGLLRNGGAFLLWQSRRRLPRAQTSCSSAAFCAAITRSVQASNAGSSCCNSGWDNRYRTLARSPSSAEICGR